MGSRSRNPTKFPPNLPQRFLPMTPSSLSSFCRGAATTNFLLDVEFLAILAATQNIASDCGCNAVAHSRYTALVDRGEGFKWGTSRSYQKFPKGVGGRRGWREEILPMSQIQASFLHPSPYAPSGKGDTILGNHVLLYFGPCYSRQPLFETSDF